MKPEENVITTQQTKTMTAAVQIAYGEDAHSVIEIASRPVPTPEPDQVLVEVAASSTNALDWHFMTGPPREEEDGRAMWVLRSLVTA